MKNTVVKNRHSARRKVQHALALRQDSCLARERAEIGVLLDVMEHDHSLSRNYWQIVSLRKRLHGIEQEMRKHRLEERYGRCKNT